ncbi:calcipressin-1 isoform X2 [Lates japonicus]
MHIKTTKCNRFCLVASVTNQEVFSRPEAQASFEALFRSFDPEVQFQYFRSFRRVRISFSDALAAAEARLRLHKTDFNGKEMRLYFAQSVHIGSPRLEPPKPEKQFLISPPCLPSSWLGTVSGRYASHQLRSAVRHLQIRTRGQIRAPHGHAHHPQRGGPRLRGRARRQLGPRRQRPGRQAPPLAAKNHPDATPRLQPRGQAVSGSEGDGSVTTNIPS